MTGAAHLGHVDFPNIDFFILTAKSKQTGSLRSGSFKARSLYCSHPWCTILLGAKIHGVIFT